MAQMSRQISGSSHVVCTCRTEERWVDRAMLPADAVCKGLAEVVVQEIVLQPEAIRCRLER
jgi:hypothetical protein